MGSYYRSYFDLLVSLTLTQRILVFQGDKVKAAVSGNRALAVHLSEWVFGERGRLRVRRVTHYREDDKQTTNTYTITDSVVSITRYF